MVGVKVVDEGQLKGGGKESEGTGKEVGDEGKRGSTKEVWP